MACKRSGVQFPSAPPIIARVCEDFAPEKIGVVCLWCAYEFSGADQNSRNSTHLRHLQRNLECYLSVVVQYEFGYYPKKTRSRDWFWFFMWMVGLPIIALLISYMNGGSDSDNINDDPYCYVDPVTQMPDC
jgi:hypothetical protein